MTWSNLLKEEFIWKYDSRRIKCQSRLGDMTAGAARGAYISSTENKKQSEYVRNGTRLSTPQSLPPPDRLPPPRPQLLNLPKHHQLGTPNSQTSESMGAILIQTTTDMQSILHICIYYIILYITIIYSIDFICLLPCLWDAHTVDKILFLSIFGGHLEKVLASKD